MAINNVENAAGVDEKFKVLRDKTLRLIESAPAIWKIIYNKKEPLPSERSGERDVSISSVNIAHFCPSNQLCRIVLKMFELFFTFQSPLLCLPGGKTCSTNFRKLSLTLAQMGQGM